MKFILFVILVTNQVNSTNVTAGIETQEFDSEEACEAAGAKVMSEFERSGFALGTTGSRAWCVKKG
jgi:hypothetical protein